MVMRESMIVVALGTADGRSAAMAASRLASNLLFGLAPPDPVTIASAIAVMVGVSALAGYVPAVARRLPRCSC